jgi:hypothetical protein
MSQQQTVLRVQFDNVNSITGITQYEFLDIYSSIPLLINKSFAELGDIGKRNSDYSVGVLLPGSKKNNKFFENYFNVDAQSLYFNPNQRVPCQILINDEAYFTGYMRLNKVSVLDSKVEYDVTLYSTPAELYGSIGNNLVKDLNFADDDYTFNHVFNLDNVTKGFTYDNFSLNQEEPYPYFYPVVHNGYLYTGDTVNFTGGTILSRTNLYTSTGPINSYVDLAAAYAAGVQQFRINSPTQGLYNNQLKPGLNVWSLLKLMFKTYGYSITSDFFNTPWVKTLYMFGYFSSDLTKFAFSVSSIQTLPIEGVEVFFVDIENKVNAVVAKLGTGIPVFCASDINITLNYVGGYTINSTIPYGTSGLTFNTGINFVSGSSSDVPNGTTLKYLPVNVGDTVPYVDGDYVDFSLVVDQNIKQIDVLSSIAKKFNLVLIPDPNNGYNIRIEPYDYFIGTGEVHNWTNLISYDKGFTVEPALNFIESEIQFTDQEDNDEGNRLFKINNNRIYGQNYVYNPTSFKSSVKKIDTIFSPELIRVWDSSGTTNNGNIGLPLGINYAGSNNQIETATTEKVNWIYKGVKTKPKLFWWLGCQNPFLDVLGETFNAANFYKTYNIYIQNSSGSTYYQLNNIPVISHTMPMGNPDTNKINNDSQCILFNSELPANVDIGVQPFNTYTENDAYSSFYEGRITNLYDPNTRVLSGYFNLSYADLKNLQPEDLIKVNEQYFVVSKIDGFNLTNRELTKVELIQFNGQPNTYIDRYFQYYYCDDPSTIYNFKTDFTNPNLLNTNFGWSLYYDYQIGTLGGSQSGFTSTFKDTIGGQDVYIPYNIYEVNEDTYSTSGRSSWDCDSLHQHFYSQPYGPFINSMPTFWVNSGVTQTGINLFTNCANFESARTTYGILTGSSITYGFGCPTPTPTATVTVTPSVTPSFTPTNTITPSVTPTYTPTKTVTPTPTITPSFIPSYTVNMNYTGITYGLTAGFSKVTKDVDMYYNYDGQPQILAGSFSYNNISGTTTFSNSIKTNVIPNNGFYTFQPFYCFNAPNQINSLHNEFTLYKNNILINGSGTEGCSPYGGTCPNNEQHCGGGGIYVGTTPLLSTDVLTWNIVNTFGDVQSGLTLNNNGSNYPSTNPNNHTWFNQSNSQNKLPDGVLSGWTTPQYAPFFDPFNFGGWFNFDGVDDYCYFRNGDSSKTAKVTFGGWVRGSQSATDKVFYSSVNKFDLTDNNQLRIYKNSLNKFVVSIYGSYEVTGSTTTLIDNIWNYVIGMWEPGVGLSIFINGVLEGITYNSQSTLENNYYWQIAKTQPSTFYQVGIGDFEVFDTLLTEAEILYNYKVNSYKYEPFLTPTPTTTPTSTPYLTPTITPSTGVNSIIQSGLTINTNGTYSSYTGTGTVWYDLKNNYNGDLINGPTWNSGTGGYFSFDGVNDYCYFGDSSKGLDTGSRTFGGWVRSTTSSTDKAFYFRGEDGFPSGGGNGWSMSLYKAGVTNKFAFTNIFIFGANSGTVTSTTTLVDNTWYYVIARWTAGVELSIYVNGVKEATSSNNQGTLRSSSRGWEIARYNGPTYRNMDIGDFELYDRALSDAEVLQNYNTRKGIYGY